MKKLNILVNYISFKNDAEIYDSEIYCEYDGEEHLHIIQVSGEIYDITEPEIITYLENDFSQIQDELTEAYRNDEDGCPYDVIGQE